MILPEGGQALTETVPERGQLKKELSAFIVITFLATAILACAIYLISGPISMPPSRLWYISFQVSMQIPATVAILCMASFRSRALTRGARTICAFFLAYVVLFAFESYYLPIAGVRGLPLVALHPTAVDLPLVSMLVAFAGILTVIALNSRSSWRENLEPSRLSFGKHAGNYPAISLILSGIIVFTFILNYVFGLGAPTKEFSLTTFFSTAVSSSILSFFLLWPNYFGEEYGWRAYLQDRLFPLLGPRRGVLVLGIIWGLWHAPLILAGLFFPGKPVLGIAFMVLSTIVMGTIFSYAVLKTGSVWIAVILHMIADTIYPAAQCFIAVSSDPIFSFGTGIYGLALIAVLALILLRSKVWRSEHPR